ncbi:hypothetical protein N8303_03625 [Gammaproteobacteria bacterium]|jgi:hypothetical protein|nr:hypothetical protein [Gammaproteobacteria bacterium]
MKTRLFKKALVMMIVMMANPGGYSAFAASESENLSDLTGLWVVSNRSLRGNRDEDFNLLEPGDYLNDSGLAAISSVRPAYDPSAMCLPSIPRHLGGPYPIEIIQNEGRVAQLFEYDNVFRIIYTDGREHPDPIEDQRFMGHATAFWEEDTLVVDTQNFNGKAWLAANGLPVSQKAHLTEWYSLIEDGVTLQLIMKYEDEEYFTRPIWRKYYFNLKNEWGIREYFCAEGNRDNVFNQQGLPGSLREEDILAE